MGQPIRLASNFVVLDDRFNADVVPVSPELYERLNDDYNDFAGHLLVSSYSFTEDWPTWELHPAGDEFVILVAGDADLVLRYEGGDDTTRLNEPGTFVIVPRNTWHTARVHSRTVMLFITPGEGTENREKPPPKADSDS